MMSKHAGPLRTRAGLQAALQELQALKEAAGETPPPSQSGFDMVRLDWFDLRHMLLVAETVVQSALAREESRGAHQREDFPATVDAWTANQAVTLKSGALVLARRSVAE